MVQIKAYILSIVAASLLCAIICSVIKEKSTGGSIVKMLCGITLAITVISPITKLSFADLAGFYDEFSEKGAAVAADGTMLASDQLKASIIGKTQAYILDKAFMLGCDLTVTVTLSDTAPQVPWAVSITGSVSPYTKGRLQSMIETDLGIPKERQTWN